MGKRVNRDSEPSKRVNIMLTPEDQQLAERIKLELYQTGKGYTGLFRALLLEEAKRRGWPSPYAAEKPTTEGTTSQGER